MDVSTAVMAVLRHGRRSAATVPRMKLPAQCIRTLRQQHGLIARRQLLAAGVPAGTIRSWTERGVLEAVERGVYRPTTAARPRVQPVMAAVLRGGPTARAGGWTACALHGLEGFPLAFRTWLIVPPDRRLRAPHVIVQRGAVDRADRATLDGVPTLSARRAVIDAAMRVGGRRLRVAIDDARRRRLLTLEDLLGLACALPRHPGAVHIRRMFRSGVLDQDGEAERVLAVALADRGVFPLWSAEVLPGILPDAVMPESGLLIEYDGEEHHTVPVDRAADAAREGILRAEGWDVLRITKGELGRDRDAVADRIVQRHAERIAAGHGLPATWRPLTPGRRLRP